MFVLPAITDSIVSLFIREITGLKKNLNHILLPLIKAILTLESVSKTGASLFPER